MGPTANKYVTKKMRFYNWNIITSCNKNPDEIQIYAEDEECNPHMLVIDHFQPSFHIEQTPETIEWVKSLKIWYLLINEGYKIDLIKIKCLNLGHREEVIESFMEKFGANSVVYKDGLLTEMMRSSKGLIGYCNWAELRLTPISNPYKEENSESAEPEEPEVSKDGKKTRSEERWWKISRLCTGVTIKTSVK